MEKLKLALPKGSLEQSTLELLKKAGWKVRAESRSYYPPIDDEEISCIMLRPQEMPRYVEMGKLDAGICGKDWVIENDADVQVVAAKGLGKMRQRWHVAKQSAVLRQVERRHIRRRTRADWQGRA